MEKRYHTGDMAAALVIGMIIGCLVGLPVAKADLSQSGGPSINQGSYSPAATQTVAVSGAATGFTDIISTTAESGYLAFAAARRTDSTNGTVSFQICVTVDGGTETCTSAMNSVIATGPTVNYTGVDAPCFTGSENNITGLAGNVGCNYGIFYKTSIRVRANITAALASTTLQVSALRATKTA